MAGMVVPLVLFFCLLAVIGTCWYYRKRKSNSIVNIWDKAEVQEDEDNINEGKGKDKTRMPGDNGEDMSSSSGGAGPTGHMLNDVAGEKRRQKVGLLEPSPPQYTVQGQQMFDNTPMVIGNHSYGNPLGLAKPSRNMDDVQVGETNLGRNGSQM